MLKPGSENIDLGKLRASDSESLPAETNESNKSVPLGAFSSMKSSQLGGFSSMGQQQEQRPEDPNEFLRNFLSLSVDEQNELFKKKQEEIQRMQEEEFQQQQQAMKAFQLERDIKNYEHKLDMVDFVALECFKKCAGGNDFAFRLGGPYKKKYDESIEWLRENTMGKDKDVQEGSIETSHDVETQDSTGQEVADPIFEYDDFPDRLTEEEIVCAKRCVRNYITLYHRVGSNLFPSPNDPYSSNNF